MNKFARNTLMLAATFVMNLGAFSALAGNEGPQAAPTVPPIKSQPTRPVEARPSKSLPGFVVATVVTGGGMPMPGCGLYTRTVYSNGNVISDHCGGDLKRLTTVSPVWIRYVLNLAANLKTEELELLNPSAPEAMDAPVTIKSIVNAEGEMIAFAGIDGNRETVRATHRTDGSDRLREAFKSLIEQLSKLNK